MSFRKTSFIPFACLSLLSTQGALAGTVKKISQEKKRLLVELEGEESVEKGDKMCFFEENGEKIGCGLVRKVKDKKVTVAIKSKKKLEKIMEGSKAYPLGSGPTDVEGEAAKGKDAATTNAPGKKIIGFYSFGLLTTATYQKLLYEAGSTSLWTSDGTSSSSQLGFGAQVSIPVKRIAVNPGFRYRTFKTFQGDNYYTSASDPLYVVTTVSASELGLFADGQLFQKPVGKKVLLRGGAGLDLAISTVNFTAEKNDESGKTPKLELASAKSILNIFSLRVVGGLDIHITKKLGITGGATLFLPLLASGGKIDGKFVGGEEAKNVPDQNADITNKLAHKKAGFGAEITLGTFVSF